MSNLQGMPTGSPPTVTSSQIIVEIKSFKLAWYREAWNYLKPLGSALKQTRGYLILVLTIGYGYSIGQIYLMNILVRSFSSRQI